jgi:hypothetical protein
MGVPPAMQFPDTDATGSKPMLWMICATVTRGGISTLMVKPVVSPTATTASPIRTTTGIVGVIDGVRVSDDVGVAGGVGVGTTIWPSMQTAGKGVFRKSVIVVPTHDSVKLLPGVASSGMLATH